MGIFNSLKADVKCEMYGRNASILIAEMHLIFYIHFSIFTLIVVSDFNHFLIVMIIPYSEINFQNTLATYFDITCDTFLKDCRCNGQRP